ncbi:MAG: hypothetical protein ACTHU0_21810 [Kofleriaceae bacterium]
MTKTSHLSSVTYEPTTGGASAAIAENATLTTTDDVDTRLYEFDLKKWLDDAGLVAFDVRGVLDVEVHASRPSDGQTRIRTYRVGVKTWGGALFLLGVPTPEIDHADPLSAGWLATLATNGYTFSIEVCGAPGGQVQWLADVQWRLNTFAP